MNQESPSFGTAPNEERLKTVAELVVTAQTIIASSGMAKEDREYLETVIGLAQELAPANASEFTAEVLSKWSLYSDERNDPAVTSAYQDWAEIKQ